MKKKEAVSEEKDEGQPEVLEKQPCPMCNKKSLVLTEIRREVPYFGVCYLFSMSCSECKYHSADIECEEKKDPAKYTVDIESEEDLRIRVVKSGQATIKIPHIITITPGPASNGFISNIEGILNRVKHQVEVVAEGEEDKAVRKKAKNMLKKIQRVMWGQEKIKVIIEDPTGNSVIISEKAVKKPL